MLYHFTHGSQSRLGTARPLASLLLGLTILFPIPSSARAAADARIVATVPPLHALASGVMAGVDRPHLLVRGSASPHHYAMRPSDIRALRKARVVFWIGPRLEEFLAAPLKRLAPTTKVIRFDDIGGPPFADPHIWLDPHIAKRIARRMATAISNTDPENRFRHERNLEKLLSGLDALDREIRTILAPVRETPFVVFHNAYSRFVARYGLNQIAFVTRDPEIPPGARRMRTIRRRIIEDGAVCVFTEPQFPPARVRALIRGTRARLGTLDPLGANLPAGPRSYPTLLRNLARSLRDCLDDG